MFNSTVVWICASVCACACACVFVCLRVCVCFMLRAYRVYGQRVKPIHFYMNFVQLNSSGGSSLPKKMLKHINAHILPPDKND